MAFTTVLKRRLKSYVTRRKAKLLPQYYRLHCSVAQVLRRNARPIVESLQGSDPNQSSTKIAVFVHFDRNGVVHDYVLNYLAELVRAGYRIWFMTNAPSLRDASRHAVLPNVTWIHRRNNYGFDFGAYKDGILAILASESPSEILICNDSVYGPFQPLAPMLLRAKPDVADIWGLTDSYELRYHLQSYFVLFHAAAIHSPAFLDFWRNAPYVEKRGWLIYFGEVALTQKLLSGGLRVRALFPVEAIADRLAERIDEYAQIEASHEKPHQIVADPKKAFHQAVSGSFDVGIPLNPTHFCWDVLIEDLGYPFIKRDLLEYNPAKIPKIGEWRRVVGRVSTYDVDLIRQHLLQRLRGRII